MGGSVPLGYDARDRTLVINQAEAETVRHIFRSYLTLGSVRKLQESLAAEGIRSKLQPAAKMRGGKPFERGALYLILQNRLYRGEIRHKDATYPGQHEAIVDHATWEAVQQQLEQNRAELTSGQRASMPSLLAGLLYDEQGERLIPTHAVKGKQRFRYYVSKQLNLGRSAPGTGLRMPAKELEQLVWEQITQLQEHLAVGELVGRNGLGGTYTTRLLRLSFLAPDIIAAILDGRQPLSFTANLLHRMDKLPLRWAEQRRTFGFV